MVFLEVTLKLPRSSWINGRPNGRESGWWLTQIYCLFRSCQGSTLTKTMMNKAMHAWYCCTVTCEWGSLRNTHIRCTTYVIINSAFVEARHEPWSMFASPCRFNLSKTPCSTCSFLDTQYQFIVLWHLHTCTRNYIGLERWLPWYIDKECDAWESTRSNDIATQNLMYVYSHARAIVHSHYRTTKTKHSL